MKAIKPDGIIELGSSGCCCPPGQRKGGQHMNCGTSWYKINDGEWVQCMRISFVRKLAETSETCASFKDAMENQRYT